MKMLERRKRVLVGCLAWLSFGIAVVLVNLFFPGTLAYAVDGFLIVVLAKDAGMWLWRRRRINRMLNAISKWNAEKAIKVMVDAGILLKGPENALYVSEKAFKLNVSPKRLGAALETWLNWVFHQDFTPEKVAYQKALKLAGEVSFENCSTFRWIKILSGMNRHPKADFSGAIELARYQALEQYQSEKLAYSKNADTRRRDSIIAAGLKACGCRPKKDGQKAL